VVTLAKKNAHEKVMKAEGPEAPVTQTVALGVKGDRVECMVNGASVWSAAKADLQGLPTEGLTGIRVSHNSDAIVSDFSVSK
jgi:hypothetical protein